MEQLGYEEMQEKISHKSEFMEKLADIQMTDDLMDHVQATGTVDYYRTEDPNTLFITVSNFRSLKEEFLKVELELYSNSAPDDVRTLELAPEETDGEEELESYQKVWTGNLDVTGIDLTDVTAKLWVTIINGNTYEAGTLTGDLTKHLKDS